MIGIFDSGLGGLTILKEIKNVLPNENYLYLGDTLHVPYGNRSDSAVYDLTLKAVEFLFHEGCNLIIIACNTATAKALRRLQQEYLPTINQDEPKKNILGVIRPVAEFVATKSDGRVGVLGTRGTVNSQAYVVELKGLNEALEVFQQASPLLVPLIEEGWAETPEISLILEKYLQPLQEVKVDTLILGCTHYPLIIDLIRERMTNQCLVPNPGEIVAESLQKYLIRHPEYTGMEDKTETKYFVTDLSENFQEIAERFLNEKINIKKIEI